MLRNNGRRVVPVQFSRGYRAAMSVARRDLARVREDLQLENQMIREQLMELQAEIAGLRALACMPEPGAPLN